MMETVKACLYLTELSAGWPPRYPTRWNTQWFVKAILENGRFAIRSVQKASGGRGVVGVLLIAPFCEHGRWRARGPVGNQRPLTDCFLNRFYAC